MAGVLRRAVGQQSDNTRRSCDEPVLRRQEVGNGRGMTENELRKTLLLLASEHGDLDAAIRALREGGSTDEMQIARLKKRKLALKDRIAVIEDQLIPDIIA